MAQAARLVRAFRALQQGHRQLRISDPRRSRDLGSGPRMAPWCARPDRLRIAVDVGASVDDAGRRRTRSRRYSSSVTRCHASSRFLFSPPWESSNCPAISSEPAALALAVAFSLGHIVSYDRKPHDAQYREAIAAADSALKPGEVMTVVPSYAIEVLRYYLPPDQLDRAVRYEPSTSPAAVLILGDQNLAPGAAQSYRSEYPQMVARLRGVTVLRK